MAIVCPTITAYDPHEYRAQIERVMSFAPRIHIDLMDGVFAPTKSPSLEQIWWPHHVEADLHLMYKRPMDYLKQLIKMKPRMVVIQAEADVHHMHFASELHKEGVLAGLAILQDTSVESVHQIIHSFDHILVFSGHLGYHGGVANLVLLNKVKEIYAQHLDVEIGWDGGINGENAGALIGNGVDVLNVGGSIQKADDPEAAYAKLIEVAKANNEAKTNIRTT